MSHGGDTAARVLALLPEPEQSGTTRPQLICIEGLGGAGKSTLATMIQRRYPSRIQVISGNDFYGPEARDRHAA